MHDIILVAHNSQKICCVTVSTGLWFKLITIHIGLRTRQFDQKDYVDFIRQRQDT